MSLMMSLLFVLLPVIQYSVWFFVGREGSFKLLPSSFFAIIALVVQVREAV